MNFDQFIERKLHMLRVVTNLLGKELDLSPGQRELMLSRFDMESIIATLEQYMEDMEEKFRVGNGQAAVRKDERGIQIGEAKKVSVKGLQ